MGLGTIARPFGAFAIGRYNVEVGDPTAWAATDLLFVAGNGAADEARANALTLLKNGNLTTGGQIYSQAGGFRFPDGTVQTTAATVGSGLPTATGSPAGSFLLWDGSNVVWGGLNLAQGTLALNRLATAGAANGNVLTFSAGVPSGLPRREAAEAASRFPSPARAPWGPPARACSA